jgi:hypothetical protein
MRKWNGKSRLRVAVLVDVDGTLVGPYCGERRQLRPSAVEALRTLSRHAPVFLWSITGADNGRRLLKEFPAVRPFVMGSWGKDEFPLHLVDIAYAVDDDDCDEAVRRCWEVALIDTYFGGEDSGLLAEAAGHIVRLLCSSDECLRGTTP